MTQYSTIAAKLHKYLATQDIRLRMSDMEGILNNADAAMENDIQKRLLNTKSETVLYQYAYEPALLKHIEVVEARRKYAAAQQSNWDGVDRRYHAYPADN